MQNAKLIVMYLYQKHIYKTLAYSFFVITFAIVGVSWLVQSIRYLDVILSKGAKILDFLQLTIYLIPFLLFIVLPISLFFTIYYTYKKLSHDREVLALYSFGLSRVRIIKTFLLFSVCIVFFHYIISVYLLPMSMNKFKNLKIEVDHNSIINLLQFNTFISKVNNLTLYIEKRGADNLLKNIFIYNSKNPEKDTTFIAHSGKFRITDLGLQLTLYNGSKLDFNHKNKRYSLIKFSEHSINNLDNIKAIKPKYKDNPYELSISKLLFSDNFPPEKVLSFRTQGHFRLLWPLTSVSIVMSMLFFLTQYTEVKRLIVKANIYTFTSALLIIMMTFALYIINSYIIMYVSNLLISYIIYCLIHRKPYIAISK